MLSISLSKLTYKLLGQSKTLCPNFVCKFWSTLKLNVNAELRTLMSALPSETDLNHKS